MNALNKGVALNIEDRVLDSEFTEYNILTPREITDIRGQMEDEYPGSVTITVRQAAILFKAYIKDIEQLKDAFTKAWTGPIRPQVVYSLDFHKNKCKSYAGRKVYVSPKTGKVVLNRRSKGYVPVGILLGPPNDGKVEVSANAMWGPDINWLDS